MDASYPPSSVYDKAIDFWAPFRAPQAHVLALKRLVSAVRPQLLGRRRGHWPVEAQLSCRAQLVRLKLTPELRMMFHAWSAVFSVLC